MHRFSFALVMPFVVALVAGCALAPPTSPQAAQAPRIVASTPEEVGKYFVLIGGCNDCHTPGWEASGGQMPVSEWLTGSPVGYTGPWGTTYASNLRLFVQQISEDDWVQMFRTRDQRPPMPWMNYRTIAEEDLRGLYRFIRSLGPKGDPTPGFLPPGQEPKTPYLYFFPQFPNNP